MFVLRLWVALFLITSCLVRAFSPPLVNLRRHQLNVENPNTGATEAPSQVIGVVAPLNFLGPYPCLALRFPKLEGVPVWNFIVDTGANLNTIQHKFKEKYDLRQIEGLPKPTTTAGMGGDFSPGDLVILGDAALAGLPVEQRDVVFVRDLTAVALPRASPTDGILGSSFCSMFPGGVEFDWYGTDGDPPTFCFYFSADITVAPINQGMTRIPVNHFLGLFTVIITVNEKKIVGLLDTGSPITILNEKAAQELGIRTEGTEKADHHSTLRFEDRPHLKVGGIDGRHIEVARSVSKVPINIGDMSLGKGHVYVGTLPAFSVMQTVAHDNSVAAPSAILGLDFLQRTYRMILMGKDPCELWVEELDESKLKYKPPTK
eukprot:scaffold8374_cov175-Amphora_coffeaeformis.AAC.76